MRVTVHSVLGKDIFEDVTNVSKPDPIDGLVVTTSDGTTTYHPDKWYAVDIEVNE